MTVGRAKVYSGSRNRAKPLHPTLQALFCQVTPRHVLNMCDVSNIWHVPIMLEAQGTHKSICDILQLGGHDGMDLTGAALSSGRLRPLMHAAAGQSDQSEVFDTDNQITMQVQVVQYPDVSTDSRSEGTAQFYLQAGAPGWRRSGTP